jgi:hypothetical protein
MHTYFRSEYRDSSVRIVKCYVLDGLGFESKWEEISRNVQTSPGAHPVSYKMGTVSFLGAEQSQGHSATGRVI